MILPFGNISIPYQKSIEGVKESGENGHSTNASKFPSWLGSLHHSKRDDGVGRRGAVVGFGGEGRNKNKFWQTQV